MLASNEFNEKGRTLVPTNDLWVICWFNVLREEMKK